MIRSRSNACDRGTVLPLVLVVSVVFSLLVVAIARLVTADLAFSQVAESRANRRAAALGAIDYGIERVRLGQTLCGSPAGGFGAVDGTVVDLNGTDVSLACTRQSSTGSDITGWAAIISGEAISTNLLEIQGGGTKRISGPVYVNDASDIVFAGSGPTLVHEDGDLWYRRSACPPTSFTLPANYSFAPANVRGPICTTATWNQLLAQPPVPNLGALPLRNANDFTPVGMCRVFSPGHYTSRPAISVAGPDPDVYFQSGVYWFDDIGQLEVDDGQTLWFGHPAATAPVLPIGPDCETARDLDPNTGGAGAAIYLSGDSMIEVEAQGHAEFFPRTVVYETSIVALWSGSGYASSTQEASAGESVLRALPGSRADAVVHGLVYAPTAEVELENASNDAQQQLLGGTVAARLVIAASASASGFRIAAASTPALIEIVLTATASDDRGDTTVEAVLDYRPDLPVAQRVAVNSVRVVEP